MFSSQSAGLDNRSYAIPAGSSHLEERSPSASARYGMTEMGMVGICREESSSATAMVEVNFLRRLLISYRLGSLPIDSIRTLPRTRSRN